ncbi:hypothetical protein P9112_001868 [Eukaryota sp. TZLM1-RC]
MISGFFIMSATNGEVIVMKQCLHETPRSVCNHFWQHVKELPHGEAEPIFVAGSFRLVHILYESVYWVAITKSDTFALSLCDYIHHIQKTTCNYIKGASSDHLTSHFDTVFLILDQLIDAGNPSLIEPHTLDTFFGSATSSLKEQSSGGFSSSQGLCDTPMKVLWRPEGVKYSTNEIFLDFIEQVNCVMDFNGVVLSSAVNGKVIAKSKLSGHPELTLHFKNPGIIDHCMLHRCARLKKWSRDRLVSFVPQEGSFQLMNYVVSNASPLPVSAKVTMNVTESNDENEEVEVNIQVTPKSLPEGINFENLVVSFPLTSTVSSHSLTANVGSYSRKSFKEGSDFCVWKIGKIPPNKMPVLSGTISLSKSVEEGESLYGAASESSLPIAIDFTIPSYSYSGLKVDHLHVGSEIYKVFKGVKYETQAGEYWVRSKKRSA